MGSTLEAILKSVDDLLARGKIDEAERYMLEVLDNAKMEGQYEVEIAVYNEIAGFYRVSGKKEACFNALNRALELQMQHGYSGELSYATTLLNKATAHVAYGNNEEALNIYEKVEEYYNLNITDADFRVASLYNNMCSVLLQTGKIDEGLNYLELSMSILDKLKDCEIEKATCNTNIALLKMTKGDLAEAERHMKKALNIYKSQCCFDVHYDAAVAAFGNLSFKQGKFEDAALHYEEAAKRTAEKFGCNYNYALLCRNCAKAWKETGNEEKAMYYEKEATKGEK